MLSAKATNKRKYSTVNNAKKASKTKLEKYGSVFNLEAVYATKMRKHGDKNWNNPDKNTKTKKANGTFNTSKSEEQAYAMIRNVFPDVKRQYKSESYPFACDFYIPQTDTYVEFNASWTHCGKAFDENDATCLKVLKKWSEKAKTSKYYANAISTWTVRDVNKLRTATANKLNYKVFYFLDDVDNWLKTQAQASRKLSA